jgi:murein DD-endopeptidase MepM/ murein hydrolase activator NlpD
VRLRARLKKATDVLSTRLVEIYKDDEPDVLTVILESDGFGDMLDRTAFLERISDQDREITDRVRGLRDQAEDQAVELAELEEREQLAAERILRERDQIASAQGQLVSSRDQLASARAEKRGALAQVRSQKQDAMEDLASLEAEQARVAGALQGAPALGPVQQGSGQLIWPVSGPITGVFGEQRPGHLHAGVDIAAPEGTPIRAADSGRVAIAGWVGGYGNYTCVQHTASMSTCYGHQSRFGTSTGASVQQGQVIGYVGNTGNSFGAHLHFEVRINGSPVDPMGYL